MCVELSLHCIYIYIYIFILYTYIYITVIYVITVYLCMGRPRVCAITLVFPSSKTRHLQKGSELRVIQGAIDHQNPTGSRALQWWLVKIFGEWVDWGSMGLNGVECCSNQLQQSHWIGGIRAVPRLSQRQVKASRENKKKMTLLNSKSRLIWICFHLFHHHRLW